MGNKKVGDSMRFFKQIQDLFLKDGHSIHKYSEGKTEIYFQVRGYDFQLPTIMKMVEIFGTDNINITPEHEEVQYSEYSSDSWRYLEVTVELPEDK